MKSQTAASVIGVLTVWTFLYFRAAIVGNVEALVKLAVAYLYNEGCKYMQLKEFILVGRYVL